MDMERFFASLTQWGISIHLDVNGAIRVKGKKEKLTATVVAQLKANKTQIAQWLAQSQPEDLHAEQLQHGEQALSQAQQEAFEQLTLHGLFEVQALEHAQRVALDFAGGTVSYGQLNLQANRLAYYLRQQGLEAESCVLIAMEASVDCIIAILAVLKAGGAFLPMDPQWSESFLHGMLNDGEVCRVLTDNTHLNECEFLPLPVDNLDDEQLKSQLLECAGTNPPLLETQSAFSLAAILATPANQGDSEHMAKGVMLEHGNMLSAVKYGQLPDLNNNCCWGLNFPFTSRFGLMSLFMALCHGGKLVQFQPLNSSVNRMLTHLCIDGEHLGLLLHHNQDLIKQVRHLLVVGHQFDHQLLLQLMALRTLPTIRLYGLLEAGFFVASTLLDGANPLLIGDINKGCNLHLLDEQLEPVEQGQQGQIYLSGLAVSRGYSQGWQLTEQFFIPSPFSDDPNEHLIATGDMAICSGQNEATFLARSDQKSIALPSDWSIMPSAWQNYSHSNDNSATDAVVKQQVWHNAPFSTVAQGALTKGISYVVFVDGIGVGNQLLHQLRRTGVGVVEVRIGERFAMLRSGVYQLNPANEDDYQTLFNYLYQLGTKRCAVIHCWSLTLFELQAFSEAVFERLGRIEQYKVKSVQSFTGVVNSLQQSEINCIELTLVTHDLCSVTGLESLLISASGMKGLLQLDSGIDTYHIDLTIGAYQLDDSLIKAHAKVIARELLVTERPVCVAFRGRHRWLPTSKAVSACSLSALGEKSQSFTDKRIVVITDDAKALSQLVDGLDGVEHTGQIAVLSDEVDVINAQWPDRIECMHTLLGDFDSLERRLAKASKEFGHIDACVVLVSDRLDFTKHVKTILSLESLFSIYQVDSCTLIGPVKIAPVSCAQMNESNTDGTFTLSNEIENHCYQQLFVQNKFALCQGEYTCIAYQQVAQLAQKMFVQALFNRPTTYCWLDEL